MPIQLSFDSESSKEYKTLMKKIKKIEDAIKCVLNRIGEFKILNEKLVPNGLRPIARSISWLVDQIVVQNLKKYKDECGLEYVRDPPHGLTQYDCVLKLKEDDREYFVNIKTSLTITQRGGRFDISKANKLIKLYEENPNLVLLIAIIKVEFDNIYIKFNDVIVFNVAWTPDIYYNRANHNLQSRSNGTQTLRSNQEFIRELKHQMEEAGHLSHY